MGRVLLTLFIVVWWSAGLVFIFGDFHPATLVYVIPLEVVGIVMAWKVADPDRP